MMKGSVFYNQTTNKYFKLRSKDPMSNYCLWKPVRKFLWFYIPIFGEKSFWLDGSGFHEVRR